MILDPTKQEGANGANLDQRKLRINIKRVINTHNKRGEGYKFIYFKHFLFGDFALFSLKVFFTYFDLVNTAIKI